MVVVSVTLWPLYLHPRYPQLGGQQNQFGSFGEEKKISFTFRETNQYFLLVQPFP
jgi:hypothetical protein